MIQHGIVEQRPINIRNVETPIQSVLNFVSKKDANGQWYYTEETKKAAIQLFAYLMDKYGIDEKHVLRHYDVTGKICGEPDVRSGNKEWSAFKSAISSYGKEQIPRPVEVLQKVQLLMDRQLLQEFHLKLKQPVMC